MATGAEQKAPQNPPTERFGAGGCVLPSCPHRARARRSRGGCTRRSSGPHHDPGGSSLLLLPVPAPRRAEELLGTANAAPGWSCRHHTSHGLASAARGWPQAFLSGHLKAELRPRRPRCLQERLGTQHSSPRPAPGSGSPPGEPRLCPSRRDPGRGGAWSSAQPGAGPRAKGRRSSRGLGALEEPPSSAPGLYGMVKPTRIRACKNAVTVRIVGKLSILMSCSAWRFRVPP